MAAMCFFIIMLKFTKAVLNCTAFLCVAGKKGKKNAARLRVGRLAFLDNDILRNNNLFGCMIFFRVD